MQEDTGSNTGENIEKFCDPANPYSVAFSQNTVGVMENQFVPKSPQGVEGKVASGYKNTPKMVDEETEKELNEELRGRKQGDAEDHEISNVEIAEKCLGQDEQLQVEADGHRMKGNIGGSSERNQGDRSNDKENFENFGIGNEQEVGVREKVGSVESFRNATSEGTVSENDTENVFAMVNDHTEEIVLFEKGIDSEDETEKIHLPLYNNFFSEHHGELPQETCDSSVEKDEALLSDEQQEKVWLSSNGKTYIGSMFSNLKNLRVSSYNYSEISCLPDEILIKIFSYLSTQELCLCVAPVCRKWRQMSCDHSLWRTLDFSALPYISTLNFLWVLRRSPLLRKLVIRGRASVTNTEVAIFTESCPLLQEIDFGFCDSLNCDNLRFLSENCKNLVSLNIEGCEQVDHRSLRYIVHCKTLTHMNFSHCVQIQDAGISFLAKNMAKIVSINLDGLNFVTDSGVIDLVDSHCEHLEELELDGAEVTDEGIKHVSSCSRLRHFGVSFCECLTDQSLEYLKACKELVYLRLRKGSDFTPEGLKLFFKEACFTHLQFLNMSECTSVDDSVVLQMMLACGKNLQDLALSWCWFISDDGLVSIVDHCSKLESLDLLGIDKIVGESLARVPEEMPHLKYLDLRQCNKIQDSLICDVVRQKKDLRVINYYGEEFVHD